MTGEDGRRRTFARPVQYRLPGGAARPAGLPGPIARGAGHADPRSDSLLGTWVAGRLELTEHDLELSPRGIGGALSGPGSRIAIGLRELTDVAFRPSVVTGVVVLSTAQVTVLVRCRGARDVAARIRAAWGQAIAEPR